MLQTSPLFAAEGGAPRRSRLEIKRVKNRRAGFCILDSSGNRPCGRGKLKHRGVLSCPVGASYICNRIRLRAHPSKMFIHLTRRLSHQVLG